MVKTFLLISIGFQETFIAFYFLKFSCYFGVINDQVYNYVSMPFVQSGFSLDQCKKDLSQAQFLGYFVAKSDNNFLADVYTFFE